MEAIGLALVLALCLCASGQQLCDPGFILQGGQCVPTIDNTPRLEMNNGVLEIFAVDVELRNVSRLPSDNSSLILSLIEMQTGLQALNSDLSSSVASLRSEFSSSIATSNAAISSLMGQLQQEASRAAFAEDQVRRLLLFVQSFFFPTLTYSLPV